MTVFWVTAAISLIAIIIIAIVILPELRANILIWRGKEREARKLLETLLEQDPAKIKLYTKLAKIYYLENRRDRRALRIFEMILRFRIPFEWRDELYTILAKHYIVEGRKDTEAIRLIEKAVDKEMSRMKGPVRLQSE